MAKRALSRFVRPRSGRARLAALGISLAAHALLAIAVFHARNDPVTTLVNEPAVMEVEILAEAPSSKAPAQLGPPPAPAAETEAPARTKAGTRARQQPRTEVEAAAPVTSSSESGGLKMRLPPANLALVPSFEQVDRLTREGVIAPPDPRVAVPHAPRPSTFSERLAERVRQDGARANVAAGKVHPQVYDFLRDARRGFSPAPDKLDADPRAPNTVGRTFGQWGRGVGQAMKSWQRKLEERRQRLEHDPNRRGAPDILAHYNRMIEGTETAAEPMDCLVCLVIRPDAPPEVVLNGSSGNSEVDRAAVEALRRSANTRPVEKDLKPQKSCYRFRATVHRIPPLPMVGCGFDEATLTAGCYYPTMKVRKTSVTLESVDYGG